MTKFDKDYLELCKRILTTGVEVKNRTGINTIKVPYHNFEFNLNDEFPILQSKQTFYKKAVLEMLWIWQMQSNDVRDLHERDVHIWDEWMIDSDGIYRIYEPVTKEGNFDSDKEVVVMDPFSVDVSNYDGELMPKLDEEGRVMKAKSLIDGKNIKAAKYYGKEYAYTIGTAYGFITNRYQHTQNLIRSIKNSIEMKSFDRRMIKSLWQDEFLRSAVLPSCVWATEWDITDNKLNLSVHQRSCDVPLGLPFNVTQYAVFLSMIAQVTGLEPGVINYSIKDAHIYLNQVDSIKLQIQKWDKYLKFKSLEPNELASKYLEISLQFINISKLYDANKDDEFIKHQYEDVLNELKIMELILEPEKPTLWLNPSVNDFFCFDNSKDLKDIKIKNYRHLGKIKFPITQ